MSKSILIIAYSHSSIQGVGSRRWIKYSQALSDLGNSVHFLCAQRHLNKEECHPKITYYTFKSKYPSVLESIPRTIFQKLDYKMANYSQKKKTKGSPYDKSARDEAVIIQDAVSIIKKKSIKNLIVSGAPFSLLTIGLKIKNLIPDLNLITDLRDPWSWGHIHGMQSLDKERKQFELNSEVSVVTKSNYFFVASEDMRISLSKIYPKYQNRIKVLLNGIEATKFESTKESSLKKLIVTHIGSINVGTEKYWKRVFTVLAALDLPVEIRLIGLKNPKVLDFINSLNSKRFTLIERVKESQIQELISMSNVFLMFKKDGFENSFPSKYFDYIKNKKPILGFTNKGLVQSEIEENNIGFIFDEKFSDDDVKKKLYQINSREYEYNYSYDWSKFTIENLAIQIEKELV